MGDIFANKLNVIYDLDAAIDSSKFYRDPFVALSESGFSEPLIDPSKPEEITNLIECSHARTRVNTLQHLTERMDKYGLDYVCLYPILPHLGFEDYLAAAGLEPRILPFTSADWTRDVDEIGEKLLKDVEAGAKGLKIHPVLQPISLQDPKVAHVLRYWAKTDLPVTSHCGNNSYYNDEAGQATEVPEYGEPKYFVQAVHDNPDCKWVSAHAGGLTGWELDYLGDEFKGYDRLWVDTTFRNAADITKMLEYFGEDRILFGTDTPFALTQQSVDEVYKAVGEGSVAADKILFRNAADLMKLND
jgi:predicted TIM-barrel fold metal-dependent hydrolase